MAEITGVDARPLRILLTGATGGIGRAVARVLRKEGATLFLTGTDPGKLHAFEHDLRAEGHAPLFSHVADFRDLEAPQRLASIAVEKLHGVVDALINCAGVGYHTSIETVNPQELQETFQINVFAPILLTTSLIPALRRSGRGQVINVSSVLGEKTMRYTGSYAASKHAIEGFSKTLRIEVAPHIRVTLIQPGAVETPFLGRTHEPEAVAAFRSRTIRRLQPEVIAEWIWWAIAAPAAVCPELIRVTPAEQVL